ncbi:MAG: hypothetical protein RBR07_05185 [Arcobacteraceae bacterium]|nr:hypothetical protein [Arcobacteraceae bacterium]
MIKYLYILILITTIVYADLNDFGTRQDVLQQIKQIILDEESIANAYERYIIKNYNIPSSITTLKTDDYLGTTFGVLDNTYFNNFVLSTQSINYRLKENLSADINLKSLYESNTFREKTFFYNGKIYFKIEDDLAKNIFTLVTTQGSGLNNCTDIPKRQYCIKDNHIYMFTTNAQNVLIMYYYIEKFKTGPLVISNDTSLYDTRNEFKHLPFGILMYDLDGVKYIKTSTSLEKVK